MAMQQVEFEFPDEQEKPAKPDVGGMTVDVEEEIEIEIEDKTPVKDRNRKTSEPPQDVTDDELNEYSEKVKKRIQHFNKGYHDERRAKEQAQREREEAVTFARALMTENNSLKGSVNKSQGALVEQAKKVVENEVSDARRKYKEAYEAGDAETLVSAQDALTQANIRLDKVKNLKIPPLQEQDVDVKLPAPTRVSAETPRADDRAVDWQRQNPWFGSEESPELTAFALGLDRKLRRDGVDPRSEKYYEEIDSRMRKTFPDVFDADEEETVPSKAVARSKSANVVASASRSVAPKKIKLSADAVRIAKTLGITPEQYAKEVAKLMRNSNG
jgi:hypothetical protein